MSCDVTDVACSECPNAPSHQILCAVYRQETARVCSRPSGAGHSVAIDWCPIFIRGYDNRDTDKQCLQCAEETNGGSTVPFLETSDIQKHTCTRRISTCSSPVGHQLMLVGFTVYHCGRICCAHNGACRPCCLSGLCRYTGCQSTLYRAECVVLCKPFA
jgi:hypothetical protein